MNAREKGRDIGFAKRLEFLQIEKDLFAQLAAYYARRVYTSVKAQQEFIAGFMENWQEPHAAECQCAQCQFLRSQDINEW